MISECSRPRELVGSFCFRTEFLHLFTGAATGDLRRALIFFSPGMRRAVAAGVRRWRADCGRAGFLHSLTGAATAFRVAQFPSGSTVPRLGSQYAAMAQMIA